MAASGVFLSLRQRRSLGSRLLEGLVVLAIPLVLLAACAGAPSNTTSSLNVSIQFDSSTAANASSLSSQLAAGTTAATVSDVDRITEDVYEGSTALITGSALTRDPHSGGWSGSIPNLPMGVALTIVAHAYDATSKEIFSGTTQIDLSDGTDSIVINMAATGQSVLALPSIAGINAPGRIAPGRSVPVSIRIVGSANETLNWTLTADAGTYNLTGDSLTLPKSGRGMVRVSYTAPSTTGTYTSTVQVTNSEGNSVEATFSVIVGSGAANNIIHFAPVITSIAGSRQGNTATWKATVSDDAPPLTYAWSADLTGGDNPALRPPANAAQVHLDGYDETVAGTLTLKVTDANGLSTSATVNVVEGQFSDSLVVPPDQRLDYVDGDGVPELTSVPTLTPSPFTAQDALTVSVPVDSDVGAVRACLFSGFSDTADPQQPQANCTEWSRTAETGTATQTLRLKGNPSAGDGYWLFAMACATETDCDAFTGTVYTSAEGADTYSRQVWSDGSAESTVDTGVAIPTFSAQQTTGVGSSGAGGRP